MRFRLILLAFLLAAGARASSVTDEIGVNTTQATDSNPRSGNVSDSLNAALDLTDHWSLNLGALVTLEGQTPAAEKGAFGSSGSAVSLFSLGVDWDATDSLTLGANVQWSPQSTQYAGTQISLLGGVNANALLQSQSQQRSAGLDISWDTPGESGLEWSFGGGVTANRFDTNQKVTRVRTATGGVATAAQISDYCNTTKKCGKALLSVLRETPSELDSERVSASVTAIVEQDTDLTLSGDYYHYEEDPTQVGFFSVATAGRTLVTGGNGVPIAPLRYLLRPEVVHRFGDFSAKLWVTTGRYVTGAGDSTSGIGLKLQYKFTRKFRMWATVGGQRDTDEAGNETRSGSFAMGGGYRF